MAEKCEFVLEPKAVEFTELIQSMTGKHQLWELWADFIVLTAISCSQQLDFRKEREERYLATAGKYGSEEMENFSRLFALVMDGYDHLLFLIIKTGLRFSEALGLTRKDFDFAAQTITVNKTWGYKKGSGAQFEPTKNASSIRTIQVDWITLQKFSDLIKDIPENEPIFRYGRQYSMCNSCANDILEAKCKQLGIPVISVHGLRHTHASLLLAAGVSIASVSKRLGHSNMSTTQNIYLHIIRELENKDNALAISSMLNIG